MSGGPSTLPRAVHRLSITSVLVAAIAFFISISRLVIQSHYFTICASVATFLYWMILAMRSSRRCAPDIVEEPIASIDSQTAVYRPSVSTMVQPSIDGYTNRYPPPPRQDSMDLAPSIPYPPHAIHSLNLFVSFALAATWSGGSWTAIVNGLENGYPGTMFLPILEGIFGYIDAVILWSIFFLCLRARVRKGSSQDSIRMYT
jgi:hypothetical protein